MHLGEWLRQEKISQKDFGERLNPPVSQSLISQWIHGGTRITLDYSLQIQDLTGDRVTPADCAALYRSDGRSQIQRGRS